MINIKAVAIWAFLLLSLGRLDYSSLATARSAEDADLEIILELESKNCSIDNIQDIKGRCTKALSEKRKYSVSTTVKIYRCRARIYSEERKFNLAKSDYECILDLVPNDKEALFGHAYILSALGQTKEAIEEAKKIISTDPNNSKAYVLLAELLLRQNKYTDCINNCKKAIKLSSSTPFAYYVRASAYMLQKELEKSLDDLNTFFKLYYTLGDHDMPVSLDQERQSLASAHLLRANIFTLQKNYPCFTGYCSCQTDRFCRKV